MPLPRAGKSAKRCQWQKKRAGFEEVPRLADTTVTGNRLARRWATAGPYGHFIVGAVGRATVRVGPAVCGKYRGINTGTDCEVSVRTGFAMTLHKDHGAWRRKIAQAGQTPACAHNLMRFIWADQSRRTAVPLAVTISMPLSAPRTS